MNDALLVKVRGKGQASKAARNAFGAAAAEAEPILSLPARPSPGSGLAAETETTWLRMDATGDAEHPWDRAHALVRSAAQAFAAGAGSGMVAVEPDIAQQWAHAGHVTAKAGLAAAEACRFNDQDDGGGKARGDGVAWNFGDAFSQLAAARSRVGDKLAKIRIAHLDTGYDPDHRTLPLHLQRALQRNFVKGDGKPDDASDQSSHLPVVSNRGHGTGTLSLLAGNRLDGSAPGWEGFRDFVGAAAQAQIIPIRVADSVVRFSTGTLVQGFGYAVEKEAHVLSMSMGGLASSALADAINLAYERGLVMVTAGGNNFAHTPTPKTIVFPARWRRVLAACGVMANGRAYAELGGVTMQGNFGPDEKMDTALGAYTPNVPWAQLGCANIVDMDGAGTSAATPQIAAACALWLAQHLDRVQQYPQPWMRVEAVRRALFAAAGKTTPRMNAAETRRKIGQGVLRALDALAIAPAAAETLTRLPPAESSWSFLNLIFGSGGVSLAAPAAQQAMLELELTQMAQRHAAVEQAIVDPERAPKDIPPAAINRYLEAALDQGNPSQPLRRLLERRLGRVAVRLDDDARPPSPPPLRELRKPPLPQRRLRVYALDPSIAKSLDFADVNETVLRLPWDHGSERPLQPGPVGEYLEVVDVDPASNKAYDPVDLNDPVLLAQDGWAPSEGNPQFHQQMVYAVAMTTIGHFERALGRRALWARQRTSSGGKTEYREVRRLRIYPHALRADNAYYSPEKVALLFGYFPADSRDGDATAPGSTVFTCLSSDVIAHEMSHALLDGLHRRFQEASNPDVTAFHEAFADIVALFQHFTVTELVRFEIARSRGNLSAAELLGGLARQFGEGTSRSGPLRNYTGEAGQKLRYAETLESHDLGSVLVFAVYEAFLRIVARRTDSLIRIATAGSGVLPQGHLHPDLVGRLTHETCKVARQVLHICIRALDYCPPVDITFGEYLRALITADMDIVTDDARSYRTAFMEAFRRRGIVPRDVRTVSQETLAWNTPYAPRPAWLVEALRDVDLKWDLDLDRSAIYELNKRNTRALWRVLDAAITKNPALCGELGLLPDLPKFDDAGRIVPAAGKAGHTNFEVHSVRPARRVTPDGSFRTDVVIVLNQRRPVPLDGKDLANGWFWFRGGATLIVDPRENQEAIRYCIVKHCGSTGRLERQRRYAGGATGLALRELYFGRELREPFALLHAGYRGQDNE
ncbi:S8 family serine peptidase [Tahibacter caeni]|uniref:S8 family serine peptidase n=1 Tax=Tahibacter caeni TaxID=1453545 RepID=UPI0021477F09|nr:S8 family serine peptidase [Tahibacter caeni]